MDTELRNLTNQEINAVTGGCWPVWVKGEFGIEGLSPTLDYGDSRLRDPDYLVAPFGV